MTSKSDEDVFEQLYVADPEFAEWVLYQENTFSHALAAGYISLLKNAEPDQIRKYCRLVREAGENGPTLGRLMATYLVPILTYGENGFLEHFLHTLDIMLSKGTYTLRNPMDSLNSFLESGDTESCMPYLDLLCDTFSQEMSYNQSLHLVHSMPGAVLSFSPCKRRWQLRQLGRVIRKDFRLSDPFLDGMEKGLHRLSQKALERFVSLGLDKFRNNPRLGEKFFSLDSKLGIDAYSDMLVSVSISQVRHSLNRYLRARTGIAISIRPLSALGKACLSEEGNSGTDNYPTVCSDGKFIYLPDEISFFENKGQNTELCKCLAKLESAHYEFGTSDFDFEKAAEKIGQSSYADLMKFRSEFEIRNPKLSDLECFFEFFPIRELAADLFTIFEHGRVRLMLNRFYPGIVRQALPLLRNEAIHISQENKAADIMFPLYERVGLGISKEKCSEMTDEIRTETGAAAELFERKINADDSVETCAELVFGTYQNFENLIRNMSICGHPEDFRYHPMKTPFGRKIRPDLFFSAFRNFGEIARKLKSGLEQKGFKAYKSDIRKQLIRNNGAVSAETLRDIVVRTAQNTEHTGENPAHILPELRKILNDLSRPAFQLSSEEASGPVSWHREWDCNLGDYLQDHVRVLDRFLSGPESDFYSLTLNHHQGLVRQIRHAFELLKPEGLLLLRQWTEGDEFDYRALLDFAMDRKAGITPSDRLYIKRMKQQRDVAVLLLADISRSTRNIVPGTACSVLDIEKKAIVLFCEALQVVGDAFAIAGFSGTGRLGVDYFRIKDFDEPVNREVRNRIDAVSPQRSTRMGGAIRHAVRHLGQITAKVRLLIILGDGFPNDTDYKREYAIEDTRKAIFEARSENIHARAITVNLAGDAGLDALYGPLRHNIISDVRELPDKLLRIYSALTK